MIYNNQAHSIRLAIHLNTLSHCGALVTSPLPFDLDLSSMIHRPFENKVNSLPPKYPLLNCSPRISLLALVAQSPAAKYIRYLPH